MKPVAWMQTYKGEANNIAWTKLELDEWNDSSDYKYIPLYPAPRELSQEEIDNVIYELRQKSFDPERWLDVYTVAIETIIQLRDELAILKKASEK
jgi:hypothetical protein